MSTWVEWSEPLADSSYEVISRCRAEDVVKWMMSRHPYKSYEQALEDFCVVHWAKLVEYA